MYIQPSFPTRGQTIAEKLLSRAAGRAAWAGELVICMPDAAMGTDGSIPMALEYFREMQDDGGLPAPAYPDRLVFAMDHYGPSSGERANQLQSQAREYALEHNICIFEAGEGIGHQLMLEKGWTLPGQLVVGADSHAVTYGALNAFGTGIGSSDLAGIFQCGQIWLKVPATIQVRLHGHLPEYASAKDVALALTRMLGAGGANYLAIEFSGPGLAHLDMNDRIVLANMSVEAGAKAGLFPFDDVAAQWLAPRTTNNYTPVEADADALYERIIDLDLASIVPQLALPHRVDNVVDLAQADDVPVDIVYIGTCTGGRIKDYEDALDVLSGASQIAKGVRLIITPASQEVQAELERTGMADAFRRLGAEFQPPGCGSCCGTSGIIPGKGQKVLSTANRNFKGRMGNREAEIFLASPRVCAEAALTGWIPATIGDVSKGEGINGNHIKGEGARIHIIKSEAVAGRAK